MTYNSDLDFYSEALMFMSSENISLSTTKKKFYVLGKHLRALLILYTHEQSLTKKIQ